MSASAWARQPERGNVAFVRLMILIVRTLGWHAGQALLYPITAYFLLADGRTRRASRAFLSRVLGRPATIADVFRHLFVFSCVLLDRVLLLCGRTGRFKVEVNGLEHLTASIAAGRGCLLLGAHFGSFEVLRTVASRCPVRVRTLMYRGNSGALAQVFEQINPGLRDEVIEIGTWDAMLRVRESIDRGELVGMLGDRAPDRQKVATVDFLGSPASFPVGPMILANALDAPVLLLFGIRTGPREYLVQFEPFADRVALRRDSRAEDLRRLTVRYATRLEAQCRAHPFNWFNFYDFWKDAHDSALDGRDDAACLRTSAGTGDRSGVAERARKPGVFSRLAPEPADR